jgi:hypothetical protein
LTDCALAFPDRARIFVHIRLNDPWELRDVPGPESAVVLASADTTPALADIYSLIGL